MKDSIILEDLETGMGMRHNLGDSHEGGRKLIKKDRFEITGENIKKHNYSFGMEIHPSPVKEIISTIEQGGYGWYSVNIYSSPYFGETEIYNSHFNLGSNTPPGEQKKKTEEIYKGLTKILSEGKFDLHIVPGPVSEPGELNSSKIFLEEKE